MRIPSTASAVLAVVSMVIVLAPEAHGFTGLGACLWRGGAGVAKHLPARSKHAACGLLRPPPPLLEVQRSHASRTRSRCASSVGDHEEGESDVQRTMRHQRQRALSQHAIDALQAEVLQIEAEIDGLQSEVAGLMAQQGGAQAYRRLIHGPASMPDLEQEPELRTRADSSLLDVSLALNRWMPPVPVLADGEHLVPAKSSVLEIRAA